MTVLINACFDSSTFCGTYVTTELLQGKVAVTEDTVYNYMNFLTGNSFWVKAAYKLGLIKLVTNIADKFISQEKDYVYDNFLHDTFITMPAVWAIAQPDEYQSCIDYMFPTDELKDKYSGLIERTDSINEMMTGMDDLLVEMSENGVSVAVIASYGTGLAPVYESAGTQGDGDLETALMLGRANVSDMGKTLGESYVPENAERLSPDRCIDVSDVLFPDSTWAISGSPHVGCSYKTEMSDFLFWIIDYNGQPTVTSNSDYPQFMKSDSKQHLEKY